MKIALVGHGRMGREVAALAAELGIEIGPIFTSRNIAGGAALTADRLRGVDAAIDFTTPDAVVDNVVRLLRLDVPVVVGTTGWRAREVAVAAAASSKAGVVYGSNFSVGVQLYLRLVQEAGRLFAPFQQYDAFIVEAHHGRKKDAPSGTALSMRDRMEAGGGAAAPVTSIRAGSIPGTHVLTFDSEADTVTLEHRARNRRAFAAGALAAAQWIQGKRGLFEFGAVVDEWLKERVHG